MSREELINKCVTVLNTKRFSVETFFASNNCFDLIARKGETTLVVKVYDNIDSIRREQGEELKKICSVLGASPILIGEKTKVFSLEDGVVYFRYDIPTVTIRTFGRMLGDEKPKVMYFKGKQIVDLDFGELRKKRVALDLSLEELARRIGVAPESLYRFEKGASTSLETAMRLEKELEDELVQEIRVLERRPVLGEMDERPREKILGKVHELGVKLALFKHSPFSAYGNVNEGLFMNTAKGKFDICRKALELKKTSAIIDADSIIITKEYKFNSIGGVPVILEEELDSLAKVRDLRELLIERKKKGRNGRV